MQHTYYYRKFIRYVFLFIAITLGVWIFRGHKQPIVASRDFAAIKASGVLRVAVEYNKLNFFVDSNGIAGFNYEIVKAFARDMVVAWRQQLYRTTLQRRAYILSILFGYNKNYGS